MGAKRPRVKDLRGALNALRNAHAALKKIDKREPSLEGLAGEILVMMKLEELEVNFEPRGGQSPYDILLVDTEPPRKVEVRTSPLKTWTNPKIGANLTAHVWTLKRKNQSPKYDLIICVAIDSLDEGFDDVDYYLFTKEEVASAKDIEHERFSVSKLLHLPASDTDFQNICRLPTDDFTEWERAVYPRKDQFLIQSRASYLKD